MSVKTKISRQTVLLKSPALRPLITLQSKLSSWYWATELSISLKDTISEFNWLILSLFDSAARTSYLPKRWGSPHRRRQLTFLPALIPLFRFSRTPEACSIILKTLSLKTSSCPRVQILYICIVACKIRLYILYMNTCTSIFKYSN